MFENFDGNMIDTSGVSVIINKLELYIENEEKIIENIISTLDKLKNDYQSNDNDSYIEEKRNNLISSLYEVLDNKKKMKEYLNDVMVKYIILDSNINLHYGID